MALHLLKLAVGIDSIEHLRRRQQARMKAETSQPMPDFVTVRTRHTPRRKDELVDGGALYWVIKGVVRVRQKINAVEQVVARDGGKSCIIRLDADFVLTEPQPRRPHQGWRYLKPQDAPGDLAAGAAGLAQMPAEMYAELRKLGLV